MAEGENGDSEAGFSVLEREDSSLGNVKNVLPANHVCIQYYVSV